MNTDLIPANNYYCYSGGEWDGEKFLIKICPYWKRTGHGTIKCEFLGVESLTEEAGESDSEMRQLAYNHFGSKEKAWEATKDGGLLWDQLKICGINCEQGVEDYE